MPITMMFASAQIGAPYGQYSVDNRVLVEAQIAVAERFGFDHVSGITETREAPDCGAVIQAFHDQPYAIDESRSRLADKNVLAELKFPDPHKAFHMSDRLQALTSLRERIGDRKIVEGWVEGPCGGGADLRGINRLMLDFFDDPKFVHDLFEFVTEGAVKFGWAQIEAGAEIIGLGDPAASLVGPAIYREFVWKYEKRIVDKLHDAGAFVRLHICGNTRDLLEDMGKLGCEIMDIDSQVNMGDARRAVGPEQILAGGIDPVSVLSAGTPGEVTRAVAECHRCAGPNYIVAAGCEVPRETPEENLRALVAYAENAACDLPRLTTKSLKHD